MEIVLLLLFFILTIVSLLTLYTLHNTSKLIINLTQTIQIPDEHQSTFDKRELTSYELERLEREEQFDQRINRLKEELAAQNDILRRGTSADELHPLVHNLPHDSVQTVYDIYPDMEVAE